MNLSFLSFLSVLQGVTELFPVSSLGHTLLVPALFGMHIDKHAPQLLPFLVALHLGTAFALLWYFRKRWCALVRGFFASFGGRRNDERRFRPSGPSGNRCRAPALLAAD